VVSLTETPDERWVPANEAEEALQAAVRLGDRAQVMGILATVPLYLPGVPERPGAGQRLFTVNRDNVPYLLVFTSVPTLHRVIRQDGWRQTSLAELVRAWPTLTGGRWGLAINPATPVGVLVLPDQVAGLLPAVDGVEPANETERALRDALARPDGGALLDVLTGGRVLVLARAIQVGSVWAVPVFTSPQRCAEFLALLPTPVPVHEWELADIYAQWPGPQYRLAVNPGSSLAFSLSGTMVAALLAQANRRPASPSEPGRG
jgi:hypothetical protein